MNKTILSLKNIVKNNDKDVAISMIESRHPEVSPRKVKSIVEDIEKAIKGDMKDEELGMYLINDGFVIPS